MPQMDSTELEYKILSQQNDFKILSNSYKLSNYTTNNFNPKYKLVFGPSTTTKNKTLSYQANDKRDDSFLKKVREFRSFLKTQIQDNQITQR